MTLDEIAKRANTSKATVSMALNNRPGVNAKTRQLILDIANEMGYIPIRKSRNGVNKKSIKLVAVLKPETSGIHNFGTSFFSDLINSIQKRCSELGYNLIYSTITQNNFLSSIREQEAEQPSAGIVLIGTYLNDDEIESVASLNLPLVIIDRSCPKIAVNNVAINNFMGGYLAAVHLIQLGHTNICCIKSETRVSNLHERSSGFMKALSDYNIDLPQNVFYINSYQRNSTDVLCSLLSKVDRLPSAFFCENDYNALCLMGALHNMGYNVPRDISVIGFDDVPEACLITPHLTTISVNKKAIGRVAINRLHSIICNDDADVSISSIINIHLIERDSTSSFHKG